MALGGWKAIIQYAAPFQIFHTSTWSTMPCVLNTYHDREQPITSSIDITASHFPIPLYLPSSHILAERVTERAFQYPLVHMCISTPVSYLISSWRSGFISASRFQQETALIGQRSSSHLELFDSILLYTPWQNVPVSYCIVVSVLVSCGSPPAGIWVEVVRPFGGLESHVWRSGEEE
jgi:hypothetical protein